MDFKIRYIIGADGKQAKAEIEGIGKYIDRLSAKSGGSAFKDMFSANMASQAISQIDRVFSFAKGQIDEMTRLASERQNAFKGLESISNFFRIDPNESQRAVRELRLVKAGIVEVGDASTALKNLLSSRFSLPEATKLFEAFSDTAAFGKSAALDFGEAIKGASEGIRNGNSVLVDNVGLTKNLTAILKDAGFAEKDLGRVKDDTNVRQALYNGLLKEALPQMGDANKLTKGWTGTTSALSTAQDNLYAATGNVIINNRELLALMQTLTGETNSLASEIGRTGSTWNRTIDGMTTKFANFVLEVRLGINKEIADLAELTNAVELAGAALGYAMTVGMGDPFGYGDIMRRNWSKMGSYNKMGMDQQQAIRDQYQKNLRGDAASKNRALLDTITPGMSLSDVINGKSGGSARPMGEVKMGKGGTAMRDFFAEELGAVVTSFKRKAGALTKDGSVSKHGSYEAIDIRTRDRSIADIFTMTARALEKGYRLYDERDTKKPHQHYEANSRRASRFLDASLYGGDDKLAYLKSLDAKRLGKETGLGGFEDFIKKRNDEQMQADEEFARHAQDVLDDWVRDLQTASEERLDIRRAEADQAITILETELQRGSMTEREFIERTGQLSIDMLKEEQTELQSQIPTRQTLHRLQQLGLIIQTQELKNSKELLTYDQKRLAAKASWNAMVRGMAAESDKQNAAMMRQYSEQSMVTAPGSLTGEIFGGLGTSPLVAMFDETTNAMMTFQERLQLVREDVNGFIGESIGGMINGLIQMGVAWISTGEFSAKAALQMLSAVAFSIASQAAIKMIFEIAEATAAFARFDFYSGSMHAAAAKMYGTVAVVAGAAGVGLALGARAMGGGGKSGGKGSGSSSGSSRDQERDMTPISKQNENTFISGRGTVFNQMNEAINGLVGEMQKMKTMKVGDMWVKGMQANPGAVGRQVVQDMGRNNGIATQMQRKSGVG